ncbi:hypothetical protein KP509_25G004000 [Ceratopteris richardii]|nr:hypothetical protein KP509_25G004000 [Ceratopteris richardii]
MAFVSVFARRFCAPDANLHVDYYGIERNNETCKLNEALMRSLPMVNYGKADESELKMMMNAECAVCLCEFEEGEVLRLLPACSHLFHKDCVDMWLFSHTTCPLCRLSLLRQKRDTDDVSQEHPAGASDQRRQDSTSVAAAEV